MNQKQHPPIIGRADNYLGERDGTQFVGRVAVPSYGRFRDEANMSLELFKSMGAEDRGGYVIRIAIENGGAGFLPRAVEVKNGLEIHMAGDEEGKALINGLKALTQLAS